MKNKGIIAIILILFITCLAGGSLGYFQSKVGKTDPKNEPVEEIEYLYYVEDTETPTMPLNKDTQYVLTTHTTYQSGTDYYTLVDKEYVKLTNFNAGDTINGEVYELTLVDSKEAKYLYSRYSCTNGVTGTFDTENWKFVPVEVKTSTCKLYFFKAKYEVTLTVTEGSVDEDNDLFVEREKNGVFGITPSEGYEFSSATCSDSKEATWDSTKNELSINTIMKDVTCKVVFKIKSLSMEIKVINGSGNATETSDYGESIEAVVEPGEGYENPTIKCTNNQTAKFANNKLTVSKLTDSTVCTVTFVIVPVVTYSLKITTLPDTIRFTDGNASQTVESGKSGSFTLKADTGYDIDSISCTVTPKKTIQSDGSVKYTFESITKDISCSIIAKESE